jgi:putative membrane protein
MLQMGQILTDVDGHMAGWGWGWMTLGWLLLLSVIVLVVWGVGRVLSGTPREREAHQILAERFARGELSPEEFTERRAALRRSYGRWERWHANST